MTVCSIRRAQETRSPSAFRPPSTRRWPNHGSACFACSDGPPHRFAGPSHDGDHQPARGSQRAERRTSLPSSRIGRTDVAADRSVRVVVLQGAGPVFCAGADLTWMSRVAAYTHDENLEDARRAARLFHLLDTLPIPLIARVQGAALGGGSGLAAVSDVVVAESDGGVRFHRNHARHCAGHDFALRGAQNRPRSPARALCLSGVRFPASHALAIGLVQQVVPHEASTAAVRQQVEHFARAAPSAVAATKRLLSEVSGRRPADLLALTAETIAAQRVSAEGQEGIRAFLEKRMPSWVDRTEDSKRSEGFEEFEGSRQSRSEHSAPRTPPTPSNSSNPSNSVRVVEVGPRDGLQNESRAVSTADKIAFIDRLSDAGLPVIEITAFVSPRWMPQMADAAEVAAGITRRPGTRYAALVPNLAGLDRAIAAGVEDIAIIAAASETFSRRNINRSIEESLDEYRQVVAQRGRSRSPRAGLPIHRLRMSVRGRGPAFSGSGARDRAPRAWERSKSR